MSSTSDLSTPHATAPVRHGPVTAVVCLALAAVVAAMSSLNVALPGIARDTSASQTELSWVIDAYSLVFAALLLPAGALGDRYGRRRALLAGLAVREEDHAHRYNRSRFSYDNSYDADGDGCYTRKEVLIRDAIRLTKKSKSCSVDGTWRSLYDNRVHNGPYGLEIDHLVALAEAWHSGAYKWSHKKQIAFGNDIGYVWDLQAITSSANQTKGDADPAEWLPAKNKCTYVKAWIGVKYRWGLPVDRAEKAALVRQLAKCSSLKVLMPGKPNLAKLVGHGEVEPIEKV